MESLLLSLSPSPATLVRKWKCWNWNFQHFWQRNPHATHSYYEFSAFVQITFGSRVSSSSPVVLPSIEKSSAENDVSKTHRDKQIYPCDICSNRTDQQHVLRFSFLIELSLFSGNRCIVYYQCPNVPRNKSNNAGCNFAQKEMCVVCGRLFGQRLNFVCRHECGLPYEHDSWHLRRKIASVQFTLPNKLHISFSMTCERTILRTWKFSLVTWSFSHWLAAAANTAN